VEIPITLEALGSFAGGLFIAVVVGLWVKSYLPDWRLTSLCVLGATVGLVVLANWVARNFAMTAQEGALAGFWGLFAATLETFGYEAIVNALGLVGRGKRSDAALDAQAIERVAEIRAGMER